MTYKRCSDRYVWSPNEHAAAIGKNDRATQTIKQPGKQATTFLTNNVTENEASLGDASKPNMTKT